MTTPDHAAESRIRERIEAAGDILPTAIEDFVEDFRAYRFTESDVDAYIEQLKTTKPHRFAPQDGSEEALARDAYLFGNLTAQGNYLRQFGKAAAEQAAARYGNTYASGKPGREPEADKQRRNGRPDHKNNPFSNHPDNLDPRTGGFNAKALTRQGALCKSIGIEATTKLAHNVGVRLGATRPAATA
jgi:hypothetical protein